MGKALAISKSIAELEPARGNIWRHLWERLAGYRLKRYHVLMQIQRKLVVSRGTGTSPGFWGRLTQMVISYVGSIGSGLIAIFSISGEEQMRTDPIWMRSLVSLLVIIGFFGMVSTLLFKIADLGTAQDRQNVLFTLFGALGAAFTQVVNYWLGSSKGSSDKTSTIIAQAANRGGQPRPAE